MDADKIAARVASRVLGGRRLEIVREEVDERNTTVLRGKKKLVTRSGGAITDSIEMAGHYARKLGKDFFVYYGNSYGNGVWRIGEKVDALNLVNNPTERPVYRVSPDLEIVKLTVRRPESLTGSKVASQDGIRQYLDSIEELERDIQKAKRELVRGELGAGAMNLAAKLRGGAYVTEFYEELYG